LLGHSIKNAEETVLMPGLDFDDLKRRAQHIARGVDRAPETRPSASPILTIMTP
jgi:hypothetical protein